MLEKQKTNVKETWKILNNAIKKPYNKPTYPEYFIKNNKRISNKKDIANGFNNFFTNVGPNLAKNISLPENDATIYDYLERKEEHTYITNYMIIGNRKLTADISVKINK